MSWNRATVAGALVDLLSEALNGQVMVFDRPPGTVNAPAVVVGRVNSVTYGVGAMGIDDAELPLVLVGGADDMDGVEALKASVRQAIANDQTLGDVVQLAYPEAERNWRVLNIGGADLLTVDVILQIRM
jgi:Mrp family chromosome partitioning ATPase